MFCNLQYQLSSNLCFSFDIACFCLSRREKFCDVLEYLHDAIILKYVWPRTVDALLIVVLRMKQRVCRCRFCPYRMPISCQWISATNWNLEYPQCKAKNCGCSVDAHSQNGAVTVLLSLLLINAAKMSLMHNCNEKHSSFTILTTAKIVDAHFNVLAIQHLLLSKIVFIMIWTYWLSFFQIDTRPCGNAVRSNILALFTLILLKFIYLAKKYIVPAIHLFINQYSQATAYHSPIIYV